MRTIEIDFDVHKLIENERRSFEEPANTALRRLLKLPEMKAAAAQVSGASPKAVHAEGLPWQGEGVVLRHGTRLRMIYGRPKHTYVGMIINGLWVIDGKKFDTPSGAASGVAITGKGKKTRLNGWGEWEVQRPGESTWTPLDDLRQQAALGAKKEAEEFLQKLGL